MENETLQGKRNSSNCKVFLYNFQSGDDRCREKNNRCREKKEWQKFYAKIRVQKGHKGW